MAISYYQQHQERLKAKATLWNQQNPENRKKILSKHTKTESFQLAQKKYRRGLSRPKYLLNLARRRAKKHGLDFNIDVSDIIIPKTCPLLEIPINDWSDNKKEQSSIDRIDNSKGYIKNNIQVISLKANSLKNDATLEELQLLVKNMEKRS